MDVGETTSLVWSTEMYEQYRHNYESVPFAEDTIEAGEELMNTISKEHRKAWQTLIESADITHSSKKARAMIQKLWNDPGKAKLHYNTTANQVAHQLLLNGRMPSKQPKARLDRKRYPNDLGFTRPFNETEIEASISALKNGKATGQQGNKNGKATGQQGNRSTRQQGNRSTGLDDIQTELIKHFGPKARD